MKTDIACRVDSDDEVIALWLGRCSHHTRRGYRQNIAELRAFLGDRPLRMIRMSDMQAFADSMGQETEHGYQSRDGRTPATHGRCLAGIKSLFGFAHKIGYLPFNVGAVVSLPRVPDTLAERILSEGQVLAMIHSEPKPRNRAILRTLYATGARVSELCGLEWRHIRPADDGGAFVTLYGKRGKTRHVRVSATIATALAELRGDAPEDAPVFRSQKGGHLDQSRVRLIVRAAGHRAGIAANVSPMWLRHACCTHSADKGAPMAVIRDTLGHSSLATTSRYMHANPADSAGLYLSDGIA